MTPESYWCPYCEESHQETRLPNQMPIQAGKCSANHRWPLNVGNWRACHAPFTLMGGPNVIGSASLCDPCWRKLMAPALAMQKEVQKLVDDLQEARRR